MVVDASVWVSAVIPTERFHAASERWLARQTRPSFGVALPSLALAEIAGALARQSNNPIVARSTLSRIIALPTVRVFNVDVALATSAASPAIDLHLRGADAVYVALAARLALLLVTWDQEILDRASKIIDIRTPSAD